MTQHNAWLVSVTTKSKPQPLQQIAVVLYLLLSARHIHTTAGDISAASWVGVTTRTIGVFRNAVASTIVQPHGRQRAGP